MKKSKNHKNNPLIKSKYMKLPLGAIKAKGWLKDQLIAQKKGLTGNLDKFYNYNDLWMGGSGKNKNSKPVKGHFTPDYYLGLIGLAHTLDNKYTDIGYPC